MKKIIHYISSFLILCVMLSGSTETRSSTNSSWQPFVKRATIATCAAAVGGFVASCYRYGIVKTIKAPFVFLGAIINDIASHYKGKEEEIDEKKELAKRAHEKQMAALRAYEMGYYDNSYNPLMLPDLPYLHELFMTKYA